MAPRLESHLIDHRISWVAAGSFHSGAVTEEGKVFMWGENSGGQCGVPGPGALASPTPVELMVAVLELACGGQHTLALSAQREVWSWGSGLSCAPSGLASTPKGPGPDQKNPLASGSNSPETGPAPPSPAWRPQRVEALAGRCVLQVASGSAHCLALVQDLPPRPLMDKCLRCGQLLYTMTDKEDHVIISDSHCCSVGLQPAMKVEPPPSELPQLPQLPQLLFLPPSAHSPSPQQPPGVAPCPSSTQDPFPWRRSHYPGTDGPRKLTDDTAEQQQAAASARKLHGLLVRSHPPTGQTLKIISSSTLTSSHSFLSSPTLPPPSSFSASLLLFLQPLAGVHAPSLLPGSALNSLVASCASAVGERLASTCEALSLRRMMNLYLPSGGATERLRRQEEAELTAAKKSCSTGDIQQEEAETLRRRLSLPGLLSQGSDANC